jgi:hypothetical protein
MKYLWIAFIMLSACANRATDKNENHAKLLNEFTTSEGLSLLDAYQRTITGGKENSNGMHLTTAYTVVFLKDENIKIERVFLFGEQKEFEFFHHEGKSYVVVQTYPEAEDQVIGEMIQTDNVFDVFYNEAGIRKVLAVPKFFIKEPIQGN